MSLPRRFSDVSPHFRFVDLEVYGRCCDHVRDTRHPVIDDTLGDILIDFVEGAICSELERKVGGRP